MRSARSRGRKAMSQLRNTYDQPDMGTRNGAVQAPPRPASVRIAVDGLGLGLRGGRIRAAHAAPGVGRALGIRNLLQRLLVRLFLDRVGFLLLRRLRGQLRHQIDVGRLRVGRRPRLQGDHRRQAKNSHRILPVLWPLYITGQTDAPSARSRSWGSKIKILELRSLAPTGPWRLK